MSTHSPSPRIAVFGHYGNQNLGDEAIIEAMLRNLRHYIPDAELYCFSINPADSRSRHNVDAFPIRYRADFFNPSPPQRTTMQEKESTSVPLSEDQLAAANSWKARLKSLPLLGSLLKIAQNVVEFRHTLNQEIFFLRAARSRLKSVDLLLVTGSNQFLDNFGGPWGFPYTLLKWTWLAKRTGTKVGFVSIGAGPLNHRLSFWMLRRALRKADYLSFRDKGSQTLIKEKTGINGPVYPDLAHSLYERDTNPKRPLQSGLLRVAVNPMPVYDSRYWHHPDDARYQAYVRKLAHLCNAVTQDGGHLTLFSTQLKDEAVIDDVIDTMKSSNVAFIQPEIARSRTVDELMRTINSADLVIATRFHATVLPLHLGIPVLGICYYRKAAELLEDVGLGSYYVDINDFDVHSLILKYRGLVSEASSKQNELSVRQMAYFDALKVQYRKLRLLALERKP